MVPFLSAVCKLFRGSYLKLETGFKGDWLVGTCPNSPAHVAPSCLFQSVFQTMFRTFTTSS